MLQIKRFINELMTSNCYVVSKNSCSNCIVIDPASEHCEELIEYIEYTGLIPEYIILTHEHTDHTWGCNTLIDKYNTNVICSLPCKEALPAEGNTYFQFYYDDTNYSYAVSRVDILIEDIDYQIVWNGYIIKFISTPGHSKGSICFSIDECLFTGDTIMQYKPYINKRGGTIEVYNQSVQKIIENFPENTKTYPGHGCTFELKDYKKIIK